MNRLPYNLNRLVAVVFLVLLVFCAVNYYLDLGFFGRFGKGVYILSVGLVVVYGCFLAPTRREMEEHKNQRGAHPG